MSYQQKLQLKRKGKKEGKGGTPRADEYRVINGKSEGGSVETMNGGW
jgi:hypothetical protein